MPTRLPSFWIKAALGAALVALGDVLFWRASGAGANLGVFGLAAVAAVGFATPAIRRHPLARAALLVSAALGALQIERPTLIGWLGFVAALAVAALAPRAPVGQDGWRWSQRLLVGGLKGLVGPILDLRDILKVRGRTGPVRIAIILAGAIIPVAGGVVFLSLFALANPVISETLSSWNLPEPDIERAALWLVVAVPAWALLRPRGLRRTIRTPGLDGELDLPGVTTASIAISLGLFNLIFALQNGLDLAYLWSGAGLPEGMSFADYAHRGAYPLIATALLAGLFVLVFLRPGSATAADARVRLLVILWIVQNLFLVASTALRTIDYVEVYSLTRLRIAALLWMALVALGLVLILWRLLRGKSSSWLINANLTAAGVVLAFCSVVDLGSIAAAWNIRHAREVGGRGVALDTCYLQQLGGAALASLAEIEGWPLPSATQAKVIVTRHLVLSEVEQRQGKDWRGWRFRDARRIARMHEVLGGDGRPYPLNVSHNCNAQPVPPRPPAPPPATAPLTPTPNPGT